MRERHGLEISQWFLTKFFNELQHTIFTVISFIELKELLIPHYIDEDNEPLEDEMVELAIRFLSGIFYR